MPRAAVPRYLGSDFKTASPGLRFTYYLAIWTTRKDQEELVRSMAKRRSDEGQELNKILRTQGMEAAIAHMHRQESFPKVWKKNDHAAQEVWSQLIELRGSHRNRLIALRERQERLAQMQGEGVFTAYAKSTAPFATGLGNEHPLENGFAFLWPHGLPYLPGSGVKGVVRRAAQELAEGLWGEAGGWDDQPRHRLGGLLLSDIDILFGNEPPPGHSDHFRGCLSFWDVYPELKQLRVEVMTPHQKHYYQEGQPPHDCGRSILIIKFLTIPPETPFTFHITCDQQRLARIAPDLAEGKHWRSLLETALQHAFQWLGFGAKTAVGYGVMAWDEQAMYQAEAQRHQTQMANLSPEERQIEELRSLYEKEKANGTLSANGPVAQERIELLKAALQWQDPALRCQAGQLLKTIAKDLPWPKKRKKEATGQVDQLLESCP